MTAALGTADESPEKVKKDAVYSDYHLPTTTDMEVNSRPLLLFHPLSLSLVVQERERVRFATVSKSTFLFCMFRQVTCCEKKSKSDLIQTSQSKSKHVLNQAR